jgi:hypothetical protein
LIDFFYSRNNSDDYLNLRKKYHSLFSNSSPSISNNKLKAINFIQDYLKLSEQHVSANTLLDTPMKLGSHIRDCDGITGFFRVKELSTKYKLTQAEKDFWDLVENDSDLKKSCNKFITYYNEIHKLLEKDFARSSTIGLQKTNNIHWLRPNRSKPREWFIDEQNEPFVNIAKEFIGAYKYNSKIKFFVDFWIGKGEVEINKNTELKGFNIGREIEIIRDNSIGLTRIFLVNFDGTKTPLVDLGYGVSQLLPIIMKIASVASKHIEVEVEVDHDTRYNYSTPSTLIIEEAEANLHPNLQAKLAELFLDAALQFRIQFILETHSEYLIYKFQEYIGKQIINPNDVALYYLNNPDSDKKYVNRVPIKEDGSIEYEKYFGTGFFDEQTNLKLSLLNIQRDSFLKLFLKTKEKFTTNDALTEEEQLQELNDLIDSHFDKLDFSTHIGFVKTQFPNHTKLLSKSINYLASGYHLFTIIDDNNQITDYSPAVLQFGRAVENEIHELFKQVKDDILGNINHIDWLSDFTSQKLVLTIGNNDYKKLFKKYVNYDKNNAIGKKYKISFGNMRQVFEQFNQEPIANIQNVDLLNALYDFLTNQYFNDWSNVNPLIPTLANIVDLRNQSAHTYANPISRIDAFNYKVEVEKWLRVWSDEKL